MADPCCQTAEDGRVSCARPVPDVAREPDAPRSWQRFRSGVMFGVACLASPCCTPLYVPLLLALLAGTPVAGWLALHLGWVYGVLTALSLLSGGLGLYWLLAKRAPSTVQPERTPQLEEDMQALSLNEG